MKGHQCFRPIHNLSSFDLELLETSPQMIDDDFIIKDAKANPRITTSTPVDIYNTFDDDAFLNENAVMLSDVLGRSDPSGVNSSFSSRTTTTNSRATNCTNISISTKESEKVAMTTRQDQHQRYHMSSVNRDDDYSSIASEIPPPRRPHSSYIIFLKSVRDKNLAAVKKRRERLMNMEALLDIVNAKWNTLNPEERHIFEQKAAEDDIRYQRELREYESQKQRSSTQRRHLRVNQHQSCKKRRHDNQNNGVSDVTSILNHLDSCPVKHARAQSPLHTSPHSVAGKTLEHFPTICPGPELFQTSYPAPYPFPTIYPVPDASPDLPYEKLPLRSGMEVELSHEKSGYKKRTYRVEYQCFSMTRQQAEEFIRHLENHNNIPPSASSDI